MQRYENQIAPVDEALFKADEYTFSVLGKILKRVCSLTITDHESFIICYSGPPYPVWVWLGERVSQEKMKEVWEILQKEFPPEEGFLYNTKYSFAQYVLREDPDMAIRMHLFAYNCLSAIEPKKHPAGECVLVQETDTEDVFSLIREFHTETGVDEKAEERYHQDAEALIGLGHCYLWKDEQGISQTLCSYNINGEKGSVSHVITRKEARRHGYASNLVYYVTKQIQNEGRIPVLYTDGEYPASNACYEGIGYRLKGKLCTVGRKQS